MGRFIKSTTGALLLVNVAMFVVFHAIAAICGGLDAAMWFGVSATPWLTPWTVVTYMFTDNSAMNLLFNCLWLWLFSRMFLEIGSERQLLASYLIGGLGGALLFLASAWVGFGGGILLGASAAILGIVSYAAVRVPYMRVNLMLLGPVQFKWIGIIAVGLSLLTFASGNFGGGMAHIGGALGGALYALTLRRRRGKFRIVRPSEKKTLDELLDKVKRSGYSSLTTAERKQLSDYSKNL